MIRKSFLTLASIVLLNTAYAEETIVTRAALDVGSGTTKLTVADVDVTHNKIVKIHDTKETRVALKKDMEISGKPLFSKEIQQKLIDIQANWKQEYGGRSIEWSGVGTAASRHAENAQQLYDKIESELEIAIKIIPQEEEGRLGFVVASAVSEVLQENLISYDSGGASFQVSTLLDGKLEVVQGDIGNVNALSILVTEIRGQTLENFKTVNPVTLEEANKTVALLLKKMPNVPQAFHDKIRNPDMHVVGIGNPNSLFDCGAIATGKLTFTRADLWEAIVKRCNKQDEELHEFPRFEEALVRLLLLYSVMEALDIEKLSYRQTNGCCEALLVDPQYWHGVGVIEEAEAA